MPRRRVFSLVGAGPALALGLILGGCTAGGQFDPTELLSSDIFNTKKTLQGEREPLFPNGVPGAETGVPPDLMKGYQPPPEQAAESADVTSKPVAAAPKPKPKPKPNVARAPTPAAPTGQHAQSPWPAPPKPATTQANWPAPPPTGQAQQAAQPAQTNWPPPPPTGQAQGAPSGQSIWPAPPSTSSH
jgi:hypothetical protein